MKARAGKTADRLTPADLVVMAMLAERPTHGYDLVAALSRRDVGEGAAVSRAQIYYSLKKLLRLGLILAVKDGSPAAGPEREPYGLSASGRRALSAALASPEWARDRPPIPFHTWLMLVGQSDSVDRNRVLKERRAFLDEQIEKETQRLKAMHDASGLANSVALAVASHAVEVFRLERQLLDAVEPMLG